MREFPEKIESDIPPPGDWQSGDGPMTAKQRDYLSSLARQLGIIFDDDLTKAEGAYAIDHLKSKLKKRWRKAKAEPMTEAQKRYLRFLCDRSGREFEPNWTKAQAASVINFILGRGQDMVDEEERPPVDNPNTDGDQEFLDTFIDDCAPGQGRRNREY
jgi:Protein of unknown function (DUF3072)